MRRDWRAEVGDSLVEVLVAVMIIGVGVTGILGGLGVAVDMSTLQRDRASAETLLRNYAEAIKAADPLPCSALQPGIYPLLVPATDGVGAPSVTSATCSLNELTQTIVVAVEPEDPRVGSQSLTLVKGVPGGA